MRRRISLAELQHAGVTFRAVEAVAIAQQLIHPERRDPPRHTNAPLGPLSPQNVFVDADGVVSCDADATPAISELAILLQRLLPPGTLGVPGSLRYTLARALLEVDAPPFDSLSQFAAALARQQPCDARAIVRGLVDRVVRTDAAIVPHVDRRRSAPGTAELRRQLRAADARVYEQQIALDALAAMTAAPPRSHVASRLTMTLAAGVLLVVFGAWEAIHTRPSAPILVSTAAPAVRDVAPPLEPASAANATDAPRGETRIDDPAIDADAAARAPSARGLQSDRVARPRPRRESPKLLDRLHLKWLRGKVAIRAEAP